MPNRRAFYPTETMKGAGKGCYQDDRYVESGYDVAEYSFYEENGVLDALTRLPRWSNYVFEQDLKASEYKTWNKPTQPWSLECESEGKTRN